MSATQHYQPAPYLGEGESTTDQSIASNGAVTLIETSGQADSEANESWLAKNWIWITAGLLGLALVIWLASQRTQR